MRLILGIPIILWLIAGGYWIYKDRKSMIQLQIIPLEKKIEASKDELAKLVEDNRRVDEFRKQKEVKLRLIRKLGEEFRDTADKMPRAANVPELLKSFADRSDDTGNCF